MLETKFEDDPLLKIHHLRNSLLSKGALAPTIGGFLILALQS